MVVRLEALSFLMPGLGKRDVRCADMEAAITGEHGEQQHEIAEAMTAGA